MIDRVWIDDEMHNIIDDMVDEAMTISVSQSFKNSFSLSLSESKSKSKPSKPLKPATIKSLLEDNNIDMKMEIPIKKPIKKVRKSKLLKLHPKLSQVSPITIHQIWFQGEEELKEKEETFYENVQRYRTMNKNIYFLWSEKEIQSLIIHEYDEEILQKYINFQGFMEKINFAKYLILHHYGGFFVDINTECKQSFAGFVELAAKHNNKPLVCKLRKDPLTAISAVQLNHFGDQFLYIPTRKHIFCKIMLEEVEKGKVMNSEFVMHVIAEWMKKLKEKDPHVLIQESSILTVVNSDYIEEFFVYQDLSDKSCDVM